MAKTLSYDGVRIQKGVRFLNRRARTNVRSFTVQTVKSDQVFLSETQRGLITVEKDKFEAWMKTNFGGWEVEAAERAEAFKQATVARNRAHEEALEVEAMWQRLAKDEDAAKELRRMIKEAFEAGKEEAYGYDYYSGCSYCG